MQAGGDVALAFARGLHARVRTHVLQNHDPVGIVLVDRGIEMKHARAGDGDVVGQRLAEIAQFLDAVGLARRHLRERVGGLVIVCARWRERLGGEALPASEVKLDPLRLRRRPVAGAAPFIGPHHPESHRRIV